MNSIVDLVEEINSFATEREMTVWRPKGYPLWWFFRNELIAKVSSLKGFSTAKTRDGVRNLGLTATYWKARRILRNQILSRAFPKGALVFLGATDNIRLPLEDGTLGHYLFHGVKTQANKSNLLFPVREVQTLSTGIERGTRYPNADLYLDAVILKHRIARTFTSRRDLSELMSSIAPLRDFIEHVGKAFNLKVELREYFESRFIPRLEKILLAYEVSHHFIDEHRPKALAAVCYYGVMNRALIDIGNQNGLPTFDIQHGFLGKGHAAYDLGKFFPGSGDVSQLPLPREIFCFGDFWKETLLEMAPWPSDAIFSVGHLAYSRVVPKLLANRPIERHKFRKALGIQTTDKVLLVTSNQATGNSLTKFILDSGILQRNPYWRVVVKLHPIADMEIADVKKLLGSNVFVFRNEASIQDLMISADAHLTGSSTTVFDAMQFGLINYIAKIPGAEIFDDLVSRGHALAASSLKFSEILDRTESAQFDSSGIESFFRSGDPVQRMLETLISKTNPVT